MNWGWRKYMLWMILAAAFAESYIEEERLALLDLNSYIRSHGNPFFPFPGIGEEEDDQYDYCTWWRVRCNLITQRVMELNLLAMVDAQNSWLFNVTTLHTFRELASLDLSSNNIAGLYEKDASVELSSLKNLQSLVLDHNNFKDGQIFVSALRSLKELSLKFCELDNTFRFKEFENMTGLRELDLSCNHFDSSIFQRLEDMRQLQVLHLSQNALSNTSIQGLCQLKNLSELHLDNNQLTGVLPPCLYNLSSLRVLDLSYNQLSGMFQDIPFNLVSLRFLSLSHNNLKGKLLPNIFPSLTSLDHLDLSYNHFEGKLSLSSFSNLSKLWYLCLSRNHLQVEIEDSSWRPSFQLNYLSLKGCGLNMSQGAILRFLSQQHHLRFIDLSDNGLTGPFPSWIAYNTSLHRGSDLWNSSSTLPSYSKHTLETLIISRNNFQGKLPENIGFLFPQLTNLIASGCHFEGAIPTSIALMRELSILDLSFNNLSGELPAQLLNNCTSLRILQLNDNNLEGELIPEDMNLPLLSGLILGNNNFGGTIKDTIRRSSLLAFLDISNNKVTGSLPSWIGNFSSLATLIVSKNAMQGHIPVEICNILDLTYLDFSENNFSGFVPSCSNFSSVEYMFLQHNSFKGSIPSALSSASSLMQLDLRENQLSGGIPVWINKLSKLQVLLLSRNNLTGQIPTELCQLRDIDILDLSYNHLYGRVPSCFANISFGFKNISAYEAPFLGFADVNSDTYGTVKEEMELMAKNLYLNYVGRILGLMSVLDLSCNNLNGLIPPELGDLHHVHSLNLSHNSLTGSIPSTFSNLKEVESLDLSFNNLSGIIPIQLTQLYSLEIFNVSFNNLTGRTPDAGQFGNFDEKSYLKNPELCVSVVNKSCGLDQPNAVPPSTGTTSEEDGDEGGLDMEDFLWSFGVTSFIAFLATIAVLSINPQWREAWFDFVEWHLLWWLL